MQGAPTPWTYVVTVLKRSLGHFDGADRYFALISYAALAVIASNQWGLLGDAVELTIQKTLANVAVGWLALLMLLITPYRMWAEQRRENNELLERAKPKLRFNYGRSGVNFERRSGAHHYPDHFFRIGIVNESTEKSIRDVSVKITNLEGDSYVSPPLTLCLKDEDLQKFDISPGGEVLVDVAQMNGHPRGETMPIFIRTGPNQGVRLWQRHHQITIQISGIDCPVVEGVFYLGMDDEGYLEFIRWEDLENFNIPRDEVERDCRILSKQGK